MKVLFYNPMEIPTKVRIVSKAFGIDKCYEEPYADANLEVSMEELFRLAKCASFDEVEVFLSTHNEAYTRKNKTDITRTPITGWFSLKGVADGGGYLQDKLR